MKVLTFVIPAYNSEAFLHKCISSMLHPACLNKMEIIVVNDGSTDTTAQIAEDFCLRYPDTVRLISQKNQGHGGALNAGCAAAQGRYLKVVDADDWVQTESLPVFLQALDGCNADVVLTHFRTIDIGTGEICSLKSQPEVFGQSCSLTQLMAQWRSFYQVMTIHGITYRTSFYHQHGIHLSEHVFYEDYEFVTFPCCHAQTIMPLDLFVYDYRIGDVQQSVSDSNKLKRIGHLETVLDHMIQENSILSAISQSTRDYITVKTQELLLSYLTTALLICPDKKAGRANARDRMNVMQTSFPEVYTMAKKKYRVFCLMNRLHISKSTWEQFLHSRLYRLLRG